MFEESGFAYVFPDLRGPLIEAVLIIADEDDEPLLAVAAERIVQAYLWIKPGMHPATTIAGIRKLHEPMATILRKLLYNQMECFLPPEIEQSFGRRLMKTFGWVRNWASFSRRF